MPATPAVLKLWAGGHSGGGEPPKQPSAAPTSSCPPPPPPPPSITPSAACPQHGWVGQNRPTGWECPGCGNVNWFYRERCNGK
eukprot:gene47260-21071_t